MTHWLEVSLTVSGELAEAVADVFARFAPNGVTTEQAVGFTHDEDEGTPVGPITVRAYLPAGADLDETRRRLEESLHYLGMIQPLPPPVFTPVADRNWMEAWKENYHPIPVGKRLIIVPAWLQPPDDSRIPVRIDPGMAFGTGTHPTTQLCLALIDELIPSADQSLTVIDVGCGSGILSIAALKLGARFALGVDVDEAAIRASRENARTNAIQDGSFALGVGSVAEVLAGDFASLFPDPGEGCRAPLVLANILAPVIVRLFDEGLANLLVPSGRLILSGILQDQADMVLAAARKKGLELESARQMGDWLALIVG